MLLFAELHQSHAQMRGPIDMQDMQPVQSTHRWSDGAGENPFDEEKLLRALNDDRQKALVSDTNRLVKLVNELDAEIERSSADSLTVEETRKLAEIEKLAHKVRDKMSMSVRGTPAYRPPMIHMP